MCAGIAHTCEKGNDQLWGWFVGHVTKIQHVANADWWHAFRATDIFAVIKTLDERAVLGIFIVDETIFQSMTDASEGRVFELFL